ncbi:MAG: hypothetical protein NTY98_04380 [Verrucomicrobia bacterium]|nr:hypothetical protein [Verrucomicrobiota bacterium]
MKIFIAAVLGLWMSAAVVAGESGLLRTYQPLDGVESGEIRIEPVTCYSGNLHSDWDLALEYISVKNVPPTRSEKPSGDLNLASTSHLTFDTESQEDKPLKLYMKADEFVVTKAYDREVIVKACLECVRRVLPPKLLKTPLTFSASPENKEWMSKIVDEFNRHDRSKVFYGEP